MIQIQDKARHVVVVGAGIMGCDIAAIFLSVGTSVDLIVRDRTKFDAARNDVAKSVAQMKAVLVPELLRIHCELGDADWSSVELVVETVPENLEIKRSVFVDIASRLPPGAIIGSNASGIPISRITEGLAIAPNAVGLHFFLPAHLVPLVEVVCGAETLPQTADRAMTIMHAAGRVPVRVRRDTPGFLANRIQHALMREVFAVLDEDLATPEDVDAAVRFGFGMRYVAAGPLMQKEFAGLDTQMAAAKSIYPALARNTEPGQSLAGKVGEGRLGIKSLHGFWEWTEEGAAQARTEFQETLIDTLELMKARSNWVALSENGVRNS